MPPPSIPNDPVVDYPQQTVVLDTVLIEKTSNRLGNYKVTEPGAPYQKGTHTAAQVGLFEGNEFLGQKASENQEWMQRFFGKPPSTQDIQNWEESYDENGTAYPAFQRRYLEKRDGYTPRAVMQPLAGLYRIRVTNGGSGYTVAPLVSFTGGTGGGATAIAILDNNGAVTKVTIKSEGTYTVVPTVVFTAVSGDAGTGAAATAVIQPAACVLTKEVATDNAPEPYRSLYLLVSRLYETMPGAPTVTTRIDSDGATVTVTRQRMAVGSIVTSSTVGGGVWTRKYRGPSDVNIGEQITEARPIPGNAVTTTRYDKESDTVYTEVRTIKELSTITEGASNVGSTMVAIESQPIDNIVGYELVTTWPQATAHDQASSIVIEEVTAPFRFPGTLDVILYTASIGLFGRTDTYVREVPQITKAYWVNGAFPDISSEINGIPAPANVYSLLSNGSSLGEVMYNGITVHYPTIDIVYPGSTPNLTDYLADWVGGDPRVVRGRVTEAGSKFRWKVEETFVKFIVPAQPTYTPP